MRKALLMFVLLAAILLPAAMGCQIATGEAANANLENVQTMSDELQGYYDADEDLNPLVKKSREVRNREAIKLAEDICEYAGDDSDDK